jgi:hypothetical protein
MQEARNSETQLNLYQTTRRNAPEDISREKLSLT